MDQTKKTSKNIFDKNSNKKLIEENKKLKHELNKKNKELETLKKQCASDPKTLELANYLLKNSKK